MTVDTAAGAELSLYHLLEPEVRANPYPFYHRLRTRDPVHWDPYFNAWIVTRYEDIITVLTRFSAESTPSPDFFAASGVSEATRIANVLVKQMLFRDPPAHTRLRKLTGAFMPARVQVLREHIGDIATTLVDDIQRRGTGRMDLLTDFAEPLPAIVTAEMLGLPPDDHAKLKHWSAMFAEILGNLQHTDRLGGVLWAAETLTAYFQDAMREQRLRPRDGLLHELMTSEVDGDRLTDEEVVANCIITLVGGLETTTNLIANGMLSLLRNPDQLARLRADEELMPGAVEELLRYESPSQHTARIAPDDVVLGGKQIRKRSAVIAVMAAGNRDPERFPDPDRLDLTRRDNRHLAFGWAAHFCFGAPLARLEGHICFETLLRRFPTLRLTEEKLVWRDNLGLRGLKMLPLSYEATP
ncbi:MAG TPA: cytochrome P450 [Candidatus Limnocylindria bacterium]|jgi:cytochrome P450|nr:cytochrome P450 [Candidatus Limnocylindria bacterium]